MSALDPPTISAPAPNPRLIEEGRLFASVTEKLGKVIVGQHAMLQRRLIGLEALEREQLNSHEGRQASGGGAGQKDW